MLFCLTTHGENKPKQEEEVSLHQLCACFQVVLAGMFLHLDACFSIDQKFG